MKNKRPLFSIATPSWNSFDTIERTMQSVLNQEFKDYEYIIIDGGSTDGTIELIKKYEPLFEGRMSWLSEPDKGIYDAFNKGVEHSHGIYCWNVNADDYMEPDALVKIAEYIASNDYETLPILSGKLNLVTRDGKKIIRTAQSDKSNMIKCYKRDCIGVPHPATLVPKDVYDKHGAFDITYKIIGDLDWFHRVYEAGENFEFMGLAIINMADGGISHSFNYRISSKDRRYFLKKFYSNIWVRSMRMFLWSLSFYSQKLGHWLNNRKHVE